MKCESCDTLTWWKDPKSADEISITISFSAFCLIFQFDSEYKQQIYIYIYIYLLTPPYEQDVTQGQSFSGV